MTTPKAATPKAPTPKAPTPSGVLFFVHGAAETSEGLLRNVARGHGVCRIGHEPVRWELVIPLDPSPAELQWFDSLRASYPGVELIWRDRA